MMPLLLVAVNFGALLLLVVAAILGFRGPAQGPAFTHMYWGITAVLLGLLGHSLTLFFFMGSGRAVKEACKDHPPAWPFIARARAQRRVVAGRVLAAGTMLVVQPVLGAAVFSGRIGAGWHQFGFWVTLAVQAWAAGTEFRYLGLNNALFSEIAESSAAAASSPAEPPA